MVSITHSLLLKAQAVHFPASPAHDGLQDEYSGDEEEGDEDTEVYVSSQTKTPGFHRKTSHSQQRTCYWAA